MSLISTPVTHRIVPGCVSQGSYLEADTRPTCEAHASAQMKEDERKLLTSFVDLLDRCLALDTARRITPKEALVHPFLRG